MTTPSASAHFRRAVMQSTPFGRIARSREEAERLGRRFLELCGLEKVATGQLKTLPVAALLAAQAELGRLEKKFADAAAPFGLTIDGKLIPGDILARLNSGWASEIEVMIGTTREEMAAFYHGDPEIRKANATVVSGLFDATCGNDARAIEKDVRRMRASQTGVAMIESLFTDHVFRMGSLRFAEMRAAQGRPTHVYQFDWQSAAGFQSCHCLEIPFVFDNFSNWSESPMLKDACPAETSGITQAMHGAWTAFVRTGNPNHDALPTWPRYRREERMTMRFDSVIGPVGDLAGLFWRVPWGNVI